MNIKIKNVWPLLVILPLAAFSVRCSPVADEATLTPTPTPTSTPTPSSEEPVQSPSPTPTEVLAGGAAVPAPSTPAASPCDGLSGAIEVRVLVGPAAAVGLEPFSVGSVDFTVSSDGAPYVVEGQGHISYEDMLTEVWGTYEVTLDLDITISGECGEGGLDVVLDQVGEQFVVVDAEDFHGEYPWAGEHSSSVVFPLEDGATVEGEGWAFVLHL
jgi:hypothetical protein